MKPGTIIAGIVALTAILPAISGPAHRLAVGLSPVSHPGVKLAPNGADPKPLGNVWMRNSQGRKVMLSRNGLASDLHIAPDGASVGWTEGQIIAYEDRDAPFQPEIGYPRKKTRFPAAVVIHRPGSPDLRLVPEKLYSVTWRFEGGGTMVGIGSQGSHGLYFLQLFDARTGKQIESRTSAANDVPVWALGLGQSG